MPWWRATPPTETGAAPVFVFEDVVAEAAARVLALVALADLAVVIAAELVVVSAERVEEADVAAGLPVVVVEATAVVRLPVVLVVLVLVGGMTCTLLRSYCCSSGGSDRMYSATVSTTGCR